MEHALKKTWAITCFFNPRGYGNKSKNYRLFREHLTRQGLPLMVVECAFNGKPFELDNSDAEMLIQVRSNSILWQKERLLNIGRQHLPAACENIVWIDADIIFLDDDWLAKTEKLLEVYEVLQPFQTSIRLEKGQETLSHQELLALVEGGAKKHGAEIKESFGYLFHTRGRDVLKCERASGLVWVGKRRLFEKYGFYDEKILGGGDSLMAKAFASIPTAAYNPAWVDGVSAAVDKRFSYVPGIVAHLYHGSTKERQYLSRDAILERAHFDPAKDLRLNDDGCFEWTRPRSALAKEVKYYFTSRNEEGTLYRRWIFAMRQRLATLRGHLTLFREIYSPF